MVERDEHGRVKKGSTLNPGGRKGMPHDVRLVLEMAAPGAVHTLVELLKSDDERVKLEAAKTILDRLYGKPTQSVDGSVTIESNPIQQSPQAANDVLEFIRTNGGTRDPA